MSYNTISRKPTTAAFWVDVIENIVTAVRNDADKPGVLFIPADSPYYLHGHPLDIIKVLNQKDRSPTNKSKKYPLIALLQDFTETIGTNQKIKSSASLNILIAYSTKSEYDSAQRYDNSFRDILYPLYDLLIEKIISSNMFLNASDNLTSHDKIDRLYWGRGETKGNVSVVFNDLIDAIEIQNLQLDLRLVPKNC